MGRSSKALRDLLDTQKKSKQKAKEKEKAANEEAPRGNQEQKE